MEGVEFSLKNYSDLLFMFQREKVLFFLFKVGKNLQKKKQFNKQKTKESSLNKIFQAINKPVLNLTKVFPILPPPISNYFTFDPFPSMQRTTQIQHLFTLLSNPSNIRILLIHWTPLLEHLLFNSLDAKRTYLPSQPRRLLDCCCDCYDRQEFTTGIRNFWCFHKGEMLLYLLGAREGEMEQEMNVVDGVLLEVDLWEGVSLRAEEMLARAVGQRVAVVAFIGGMEKIKGAEEAIERINEIVGRLNEVAKAFGGATAKELSIQKGNIAFGSISQGWALTSTPITLQFFRKLLKPLQQSPQTLKSKRPLVDCIFHIISTHIPNPKQSQSMRSDLLYTGPQTDQTAQSFRQCNPKGPLLVYLFRSGSGSSKQQYTLGRVYSGTVQTGMKVKVMGFDYSHGHSKPLYKNIQSCLFASCGQAEKLPQIPCGNFVCIPSRYLSLGTLSILQSSHPINHSKLKFQQVVRVPIEVVSPADLPQLIDGMNKLAKGSLVKGYTEETGEFVMKADTVERIEGALKEFEWTMPNVKIGKAMTVYKETITESSNQTCMARSQNKHNRLYATAKPLVISPVESNEDHAARARRLCKQLGWELGEANNIWTFGFEGAGLNILINRTEGVMNIREIKDSTESAFNWATKEGLLCDEQVRNCRIDLLDCELHTDAIHRGGGQIIPAGRRLFYACQFVSRPTLIQPFYEFTVKTPEKHSANIIKCFQSRNGRVISQKSGLFSEIIAEIPVADSFDLKQLILQATKGQTLVDISGIKHEIMEDFPEDAGSKSGAIVREIRKAKGLKEEGYSLDALIDHF